jgi:2,4-dienoyl-CoA reductase-like NADH-dependent reductase (Old Yellow Enzyme family)
LRNFQNFSKVKDTLLNFKFDPLISLRIVQFIHSQNCAAGIQLAHAGRKASTKPPFHQTPGDHSEPAYATKEEGGWPDDVVAPSPLPFAKNYCTPKEMSIEQIEQFKQDFIKTVERSDKCEFDFLEIHAAHGYLLTEFLSPSSNKRKDQYGEFSKEIFLQKMRFETNFLTSFYFGSLKVR